jgi:hypothetical protein
MPQLGEQEELGSFGVDYVRSVIQNGWRGRFITFQGTDDRGIDGTVVDLHRAAATGLRFDVQVKTSRTKFRGETFVAPIERKHLELYRASNIPTLIICVDATPPVTAFWNVVDRGKTEARIVISRREVFGPASRPAVIGAIKEVFPERVTAARGELLEFPLHRGIRDTAKAYYRRLMHSPLMTRAFGPVEFTWKGWRHITRRARSSSKIPASFLLLPCVGTVLDGCPFPTHRRPLENHRNGSAEEYRTLLTFQGVVTFAHRAPAWVRVVIEFHARLPADWTSSPPDDPRRKLVYRFLSLSELRYPVPTDYLRGNEQ